MLGQRRRRWANIKPVLVQCLVFAGNCDRVYMVYLNEITSDIVLSKLYHSKQATKSMFRLLTTDASTNTTFAIIKCFQSVNAKYGHQHLN